MSWLDGPERWRPLPKIEVIEAPWLPQGLSMIRGEKEIVFFMGEEMIMIPRTEITLPTRKQEESP